MQPLHRPKLSTFQRHAGVNQSGTVLIYPSEGWATARKEPRSPTRRQDALLACAVPTGRKYPGQRGKDLFDPNPQYVGQPSATSQCLLRRLHGLTLLHLGERCGGGFVRTLGHHLNDAILRYVR